MSYLYPDLDFYDLKSAYDEANNNYKNIAAKVSQDIDVSIANLRTVDYLNYVKRNYNVEFQPFPFTGEAVRIFAGSLMIGNSGAVEIGYNSSVNQGRQNFSKLHEINHLFNDVPSGFPGESFSDLFKNGKYNPEEQYMEAIANFGAAMMQIPEGALLAMIIKGEDLNYDFSNQFASSFSANFVRLRDYLVFGQNINPNIVSDLVSSYKTAPTESKLYKVLLSNFKDSIALQNQLNTVRLKGDREILY